MKLISFIEPHYLDPKIIVEVVLTEDEVLDVYWDYWKDKMEKAEKPSHLITESNCIEDFITVHWAVNTVVREDTLRLTYDDWLEYCKMRKRYEKEHS